MTSFAKRILRPFIYFLCFIFLIPFFIASRSRIFLFPTLNDILSLIPGVLGAFIRRVWYKCNLKHCGKNLYVDFGAVFITRRASVGDNCYIGRHCILGNVQIGNDLLMAAQSMITSKGLQHGLSSSLPMMLQNKDKSEQVKVGDDVWICLNSVIVNDLAKGTVVGANSFVNKVFDEYSILGGSPAKFLKKRPV